MDMRVTEPRCYAYGEVERGLGCRVTAVRCVCTVCAVCVSGVRDADGARACRVGAPALAGRVVRG